MFNLYCCTSPKLKITTRPHKNDESTMVSIRSIS